MSRSCANCGQPMSPAGRVPQSGISYCYAPDCRRVADRLKHQRYMSNPDIRARFNAYQRRRRQVMPIPQAKSSLPPIGAMTYDAEGVPQCHICGRFYRGLGLHISRGHRVPVEEYRERYGLMVGQPLVSHETSRLHSQSISNTIAAGKLSPRPELLPRGATRGNTQRLQARIRQQSPSTEESHRD